MVETITKRYGKIDAVVNSAYPKNENYGRKFEDVLYEDFCENVSLHLGGFFLVCQQLALYFKRQAMVGNGPIKDRAFDVTATQDEELAFRNPRMDYTRGLQHNRQQAFYLILS